MASTVVKDENMEIDENNVDENDAISVEDEDDEIERREESQPKKRIRRNISTVWKHFTKVTVSEGCTRAVCKKCKQSLVYNNGSKCLGTSHLKRHIATGICVSRTRGTNSQKKTPDTPKDGASGSASIPSGKHCGESFIQIHSGHEDSGMTGQIGADSELQPASLSPASNQSLDAAQGKITTNKSGSCEANAIFIDEPEHFPSSEPNTMSVRSILLAPVLSVNDLPGKAVDVGNQSSCFTVKTETIESLEVVGLVEEPVDTAMKMSSVKGPTPSTVNTGNQSSSFTVETGTIETLEVVQLVKKPMEATMNMSSAMHPTPSIAVDVNPSSTSSTTIPVQGKIEEIKFVDNFPKEYAGLYRKIYEKYGHMATKNVIKVNDDILLTCTISLLKNVSEMETTPGKELSVALVEKWEGYINDAEALGFNIKWLREGHDQIKNRWRSSININTEVERRQQVLDATQVKYDDLCTRKGVLESALSDVKIQISETEVKISSERAVQGMLTEDHIFQNEPVSRWL